MKTQAVNKAYKLFFSAEYLYTNREPKLDRRFNLNKEILKHFKLLKNTIGINELIMIKDIKRHRSEHKKAAIQSILERPLVVDFIKNKRNVLRINEDRIMFKDGRNHWAKDNKDLKILSILRKSN